MYKQASESPFLDQKSKQCDGEVDGQNKGWKVCTCAYMHVCVYMYICIYTWQYILYGFIYLKIQKSHKIEH